MAPRLVAVLSLSAMGIAGCATDVARLPAGDPARGRAVFVEMQCHACHRVSGDPGLPAPTVQPPVRTVLGGPSTAWHDAGSVATDIAQPSLALALLEPQPTGPDGRSRMPDLARRLTVQELADLSAWVASTYTRVPTHRW